MSIDRKLEVMKHFIGLDYKTPYMRNGKRFYRPYRNYYSSGEHCDGLNLLLELERDGFATRRSNKEYCFWLTIAGLDWLGKTLNITIYDDHH